MNHAPGGWLDQDDIVELRRAIRGESEASVRRAREERDMAATMTGAARGIAGPNGYSDAAGIHEQMARMHDARRAMLERIAGVFAHVENGARIEALASPADDEAHARLGDPCACGHSAHWHGAGPRGMGSGCCEHDADCPCSEFANA